MKPVKVIHLIRTLEPGGCENFLVRALPSLTKHGVENQLITLQSQGKLAENLTRAGISVKHADMRHWLDIPGYRRLYRIIKATKPDVITTYLFHADAIGRLLLRFLFSVPIIPFLRTTYNHRRYTSVRIFERITKPLVTQYLANSSAVKNFYTKSYGIHPDSITVITNGIDTSAFHHTGQERLSVRRSLSLNNDAIAIICVANFHPNKGHHNLLKTFFDIHDSIPHSHLLLVGSGSEYAHLLNLAQKEPSHTAIQFLGLRRDVINLLQAADIFVLPTQFEGMSNALLEAMASSLPIITTDIPENHQVIVHNENGLLYPKNNNNALESAIRRLYSNPKLRHRLGTAARLTINDNFSLDLITAKWANFYHQMVL